MVEDLLPLYNFQKGKPSQRSGYLCLWVKELLGTCDSIVGSQQPMLFIRFGQLFGCFFRNLLSFFFEAEDKHSARQIRDVQGSFSKEHLSNTGRGAAFCVIMIDKPLHIQI
ncbi:hypothetical protein CEXT_801241 [Caerostris extrusa]|uniref:Uncharacterized protein n=1 Tax=Caerostris extrusa TaxID=172846 RepID=A0AAV4NGN8_CAEEX|nr:hypothetical protein CEXT_801241 [Caerostris extrusa]